MGKKLEEISLTFNRERIRFDGSNVAILECRAEVDPEAKTEVQDDLFGAWNPRNEVIVKAECEPRELTQGLSYRFYGTWSTHPKHGRQFQAKTFVHVQPHGRAGTIRYLMQAPCVGQVTAVTLWDKFQGDAVRILREQPEVAAAAVDRFGQGAAAEASVWLRGQATMEGVTIDLIDLLGGRGFPKNTAKKAVEEWGNRAAEFIGRNPYILGQFRGCGFLRCDQLYHDLGGDPGRLKRQALCASYVLARDRAGHTWHRPQLVERGLRGMISGATVRPLDACRLAKRAKMISVRRDAAGLTWITDRRKANNEADAAERVLEWFREPASWPTIADIDASDHKRQVAVEALQAAVAILTGGPGTGKTYLAVRIIKRIIAVFGADVVAVAAPTGKAAVRITEAMQGYGINLRARTIHSLLGVESRGEGDGWGFKHGPDLPLEYRFIIVDEASMMDTDLAASLFRACAKGTHILLVGDVGQLPPVGHGAPLRDLIAAGVPTGELTEVMRNSGRIVGACHEIRAGKRFVVSSQLDIAAGENLRLLPAVSSAAALEQIVTKSLICRGRPSTSGYSANSTRAAERPATTRSARATKSSVSKTAGIRSSRTPRPASTRKSTPTARRCLWPMASRRQ